MPYVKKLSTCTNANIKQNIHTHIFEVFNITPAKRVQKARTFWYCQPSHLMYQYQIKDKDKKGMDRNKNKKSYINV